MNKGPISRFLIRWFVCTFGLWVAAAILGGRVEYDSRIVVVVAGLLLAIVNALIKPIVVLFSLPAILFSLGLFMIVINGLMVLMVSRIYDQLMVTNFGAAVLVGMIIGFVNYLVTTILEEKDHESI